MKYDTFCPVCGYELGFLPWEDELPSDEICPSCGIQFGYDDIAGRDEVERAIIYQAWRQKWIAEGMKWHSKETSQPDGWDPSHQLEKVKYRWVGPISSV